jgi:hypothetical protein
MAFTAQARDKKGNPIKRVYEYYKEKHKQLNTTPFRFNQHKCWQRERVKPIPFASIKSGFKFFLFEIFLVKVNSEFKKSTKTLL